VIENLHDKHQQQFLRGHDMEISAITLSNSGSLIATGQLGTVFQKLPEAPIILWNYETKQPVAVLKGIQVRVKQIAFSPDDRFLAAIGEDNAFIIWDTRDGQPIHSRVTEFPIAVIAWSEQVTTSPGSKHPTYTLVTANQTNVFVNTLDFQIGSMQYILKQEAC
jgi:WD40 repeat protein